MSEAKFFDLYLRGEALEEEIDAYVERWHEIAQGRTDVDSLADFLGMTASEYAAWAMDGTALPRLLMSRAARPRVPLVS